MLRLLRYALVVLAVLAAAGAAAGVYLLQDPNRFKPELEALIERQSGIPLTIGGDLSWRLWPPLSLSAAGLSARHQGQDWQVGRLTLELDALKVLSNPQHWEVQSLMLNDVTVRQDRGVVTLGEAHLRELTPGQPAPFSARLDYAPVEGQPPIPLTLDGKVSIDPQSQALAVRDTRFETSDAAGVCEVQAAPAEDPAPIPAAKPEDIIPVEALLAYDWSGHCRVDWLLLKDRRFENLKVTADNQAGKAEVTISVPEFFDGRAAADVAVDARQTPLRWTVTPNLENVNSSELIAWLDQDLQWAAPLAYGGTLTFEGNSEQQMLTSLSGETRFDGGQGSIDISRIRNELLPLARMFNEEERIRSWPDVWDYQRFVGTWRIDGKEHRLAAVLDNLALTAAGDYDPMSDQLDMLAELVFTEDPDWPIFDVDPLLYDLPIPVHCRGTMAKPECRLDQNAAQRIVLAELGRGDDSDLRRKLETKIEQDVPEEYRDAARSLLELLGNSQKDAPPKQ
ncbi:MAG: hypothetical protein U5Q16_12960 [Gammaproteobacteria bacterium]|nr:hypothetical protein [Gammaproteobacteria bacterium]